MNTSKLTVVFLAVLIATLIIWVTFFEHEKSIILKSGDEFTIEGKIASVDYMNTTYGTFPIVYLDSIIDILEDANILDDGIYNSLSHESLPDILGIFGNLDEEYHAGDNFKTTLHFEKFSVNGITFYWFKELSFYLELMMDIESVIDGSSCSCTIGLIQTSADDNLTSYEVFSWNGNSYPMDSVNMTLIKTRLNDTYSDGILFSEAANNIISVFAQQYMSLSGSDGSTVDFMDSLENKVSQNGTIEFVDMNNNDLLDDGDIFNIHILPTSNETTFHTYLLSLGNAINDGYTPICTVNCIVEWYSGSISDTNERRVVVLSHVSDEQNGSSVDTAIEILRTIPGEGYPSDMYFLRLGLDNNMYDAFRLAEGVTNLDENISVEYVDSNSNSLLDIGDFIIVHGLYNDSHAEVMFFKARKTAGEDNATFTPDNNIIGYIRWTVGDTHV